jgi:hypothetical protein
MGRLSVAPTQATLIAPVLRLAGRLRLHRVPRSRVIGMKKSCKPLPDRLPFGLDRGFKQILSCTLREVTPAFGDRVSERSRDVVGCLVRHRPSERGRMTRMHAKLIQRAGQRLMFRTMPAS